MKFARQYFLLGFFALFIWGLFAADMFTPPRERSAVEELAQRPGFSVHALFARGDAGYTLRYEEFVNDQFVGRDSWITLKSVTESALLKRENNGIVYGAGGQMFEPAVTADTRQLWRNVDFIADFAAKYAGENITLSIIPTSYAILTQRLPAGLPVLDQLGVIDDIERRLSGAPLRICDLAPALREHAGEYIYYRTDHHWTSLGAHLAYERYMTEQGKPFTPLASLPAHEVPGFYGTYYNKAKKWNARADTVTWYDVPVDSVTVEGGEAGSLYNSAQWAARDKYAAFLHGNNGVTIVKNSAGQGRLLLFKDSYGNAVAPFLASSYAEVHIVDLRYYSSVPALMEENDYDGIYILYNFDTLLQDQNLFRLTATG